MYSNLETKKTKKKVTKEITNKDMLKINKLIPETNIITNQTDEISKVCPRSGWDNNKIIVGIRTNVLKKYLKYKFFLSSDNMKDIIIIKKGLTVSIGWNLGKAPISNHLLDPFISTPINGTKNKLANVIKNKKIDIFTRNSWFKIEKIKIIEIPRHTKTKCLKKK